MKKQQPIDPQVLVEQISRSIGPAPDQWLVAWRIQNLGEEPLQILAARLPHGQFRRVEQELAPVLKLLPKESARFELEVTCSEPPGTIVENAFLILRLLWLREPWWVFARLRVVFDEQGGPQTMTELITTQRVGFSVHKGETY